MELLDWSLFEIDDSESDSLECDSLSIVGELCSDFSSEERRSSLERESSLEIVSLDRCALLELSFDFDSVATSLVQLMEKRVSEMASRECANMVI